MPTIICRIKDFIQPFERQLALAELRTLAADEPEPLEGAIDTALSFRVSTHTTKEFLRTHLAFWVTVGASRSDITSQIRGEATSLIARNGVALEDIPRIIPEIVDSKLPNKRCLRYATHGLHEYRGKFFPQLVRSLINVASVPANGIVLDPMCGSGTTLVETALSGRRAFGLDINPLSVFIAAVKCETLGLDPVALVDAHRVLVDKLRKPKKLLSSCSYFSTLLEADQSYLLSWFSPQTLTELDQIELAIRSLQCLPVQNFYSLCLSNILRDVSWQKSEDLRVRKEVAELAVGEVIARFIKEATRSTKSVVAFILHRGRNSIGHHSVLEGDVRDAASILGDLNGQVDCIITSPPYATALPYLDTDRLSLIYLGLLPRKAHRSRDMIMIGNREVTKSTRDAYWEHYRENRMALPKATRALIDKVDRLNRNANVGFRRKNLSSLLAKYFFDMHSAIEQQQRLLKTGGVMFMVIGNNRTTAGGQLVEIRTTNHLAQIAEAVGFRIAGNLSMDMLISRDIFSKNAMSSEQIITLQKD